MKKTPKDYEPNFFPKDKTLIVVGKSSFTKSSILMKLNLFEGFLEQVKNENYKLIYIRDEAHYGDLSKMKSLSLKNKDLTFNFESQIQEAANFVLKMTATFDFNTEHKQVIIEEKDLIGEKKLLLKSNMIQNKNVKSALLDTIDNFDFLKIALKEFKEIQNQYKKLNINPALLVQVDSQTQKNQNEFNQNIQKIISILEQHNLSWVKYFSGDNKESNLRIPLNLNEISHNSSPIDAVIFKIGPATGWDIPRACMLIQLRNVSSETLNKQTLGRIKRNPILNLNLNKITDNYYLYSNYQPSNRRVHRYCLKEEYKMKNWLQGRLNDSNRKTSNDKYLNKIRNFLLKENDFAKIIFRFKNKLQNKEISFLPWYSTRINEQGYKKIIINKKILNVLELRSFVLEKKQKFYFLSLLNSVFLTELIEKYSLYSIDLIFYLLFDNFFLELRKIYEKLMRAELNTKYYLEEKAALPHIYDIWGGGFLERTSLKKEVPFVSFCKTKEFYTYLNVENKEKYIQYLDSNPERVFFKSINKALSNLRVIDNCIIWAKNPGWSSQIRLQYLDNDFLPKNSCVDLVLQINKKYWYIEIKSTNDLTPDKTKNILKAMEEYKNNHINSKYQFVFSLIKVEKKNKAASSKEFYKYICEHHSNISNISLNQEWKEVLKVLSSST